MPFWPLVFTSCGFLLPAVLSRRKKPFFATACKAVSITSVLYHATCNALIQKIDIILAHSVACYGVVRAWYHTFQNPSRTRWCMVITPILPIYLYTQKSAKTHGMESKMWHLAFHISGQACLSLYAQFF